VKRTGNESRYAVEQTLEMYFTDAVKSFYDAAYTLGAIDSIVQLGVTPGKMVIWSCPKWQPRAERTEQDGEVGLRLVGDALGPNGDDEVSIAFV
jgi:hypothetical protein